MNKKIKIPKGWTFKCIKVDGEQTEFVYEDEFGDEHSYFKYGEHIPTYEELEERINTAIVYIEKNKYLKLFSDITGPNEYELDINPEELLNILKGSDNNE